MFGSGADIYLGRTDNKLCPVVALPAYLEVRGGDPSSLFRQSNNDHSVCDYKCSYDQPSIHSFFLLTVTTYCFLLSLPTTMATSCLWWFRPSTGTFHFHHTVLWETWEWFWLIRTVRFFFISDMWQFLGHRISYMVYFVLFLIVSAMWGQTSPTEYGIISSVLISVVSWLVRCNLFTYWTLSWILRNTNMKSWYRVYQESWSVNCTHTCAHL